MARSSRLALLYLLTSALGAVPAAQKTAPGSPPVQSPVPLAHFGAHPPRGEAPLTVRFEDRSFGDITAWQWDFGDGTGSTQRNPSHLYTQGGVYEVRLTVNGPDGSATVVKPRGVTVTTCTPGLARLNRPSPLERGEDFVPVTGDDGLGFWCVYSGKAISASNPGLANNVGMFVFPLTNGEVLLFGSGYGDANSMVAPTESAAYDVRRIDGILRFCLGLVPELTTVRFVAPHGHIDHINSDCIHELRKRGYRIAEIVFHTLDGTESRNLPGWTAEDQALFRTIRNSTGSCQEDLLSYSSPLGRIWFHVRPGHTNGSIDLVLDTLGDANNRFLVLGSGSSYGDCPIPGVRESIEPHGNVLLTAPQPILTAISPDHLSALGGTEVVLTGGEFAASRAGLPLVLFDGVPATQVRILDDTTLLCLAPAGIPGERGAVELVNRNGSASLPDAFRYRAWPTLLSVSPAHGVESGGTRVTLRGTGFLDDAAGLNTITLDGVPATGLASVTDTSLTCLVPAGVPGLATLALANANGHAELVDAFRYDPRLDVLGVTPASGSARGGLRVQISGSAFAVGASTPQVFFAGAPATDVVRISDSRLDCTTPPGTPGAQVDVRVTGENGTDTLPAGFRYFAAPSIASASPVSGPAAGGQEITLAGSSFQRNGAGPNTVLFGSVPALSVTPVSDTALRCIAPPGVAGTSVDLVVSNANGSGRLTNGYRYHRAPALASLEPASGPRAGGVSVTLHGSAFAETESGLPVVLFGSVAALDVLVLDDTRLTCRAPAQTSDGLVDVLVTTNNGSGLLPGAFRYFSRPTLTSLAPVEGSSRGGTQVTLYGSDFLASGAGTTEVRFGGQSARAVRVLDDGTLTAVTPPGAPGTRVHVRIANENGSAQLPGAFRYRELPTLDSVAPMQGPPAGGTLVTLQGSGFQMDGLTVEFDGVPASGILVQSENRLTCLTPPGARGAVAVLVRGGDGSAALGDGFVYGTLQPLLAALEPDHGVARAPGLVTLRGSGFLAAQAGTNRITFGGLAASEVVVQNDERLTCRAPAGTPGTRVDVRLANRNGADTLLAGYRYHLEPTLTGLEPAVASPAGGSPLTLRGSGFQIDQAGEPRILVGTQPATGVVVLDDASLTCNVPPGVPGALVDVTLENANGSAQLTGAFLYRGAPELVAVAPAAVSPLGGAPLTLSGVGFLSATTPTVRIAGSAASAVVVLDDTRITCVAPAGSPGLADVELTNENGSSRLPAALRYFAAPDLVTRSPSSGTPQGGTTVTLTGSGFLNDVLGPNSVTFGGVPARSVTTVDDTRVRAVTPGGTPGSVVDVQLRNSNGLDTLPASFRYHLEPTLANLTPPSSAAPGGVQVTLSGSGFQRDSAGVATVLFGAVPATSVSVLDDQTITCLAPPGVAGSGVTVQVSNKNGATREPVTFAYHAAPTLAGVSPSSGAATGGTPVQLSGSGFLAQAAGTNQVRFGSTPASQVVVLDDATLTCVAPPGTRGARVDVGLVNANGAALLAGAFLYRSAPELVQVTPASVSPLGGATLTLDGLNFTAATAPTVRIGGTQATSVVTLSDTQVTCVVPAGSGGSLVDVELTTENGSARLPLALRYFAAPDLVARSPASGTSLGGTTVVLTGSGFLTEVLGPNSVTFGGVPARSVTTVDDTRVRAVSPAMTPGSVVDLRLSNANGQDELLAAFRVHLEPTLASLAPPSAAPAGGVTVTLTGSGFLQDGAGAPAVLFGATLATSINVLNDQTLTCVAPAGVGGTQVLVQVSNRNGASRESVPFAYRAAPTLTSVNPTFGFSGGGALVELTGSGFLAEAPGPHQVLFGAAPATEIVVVNDATLRCRVPAGAPGAVSIQVTNDNGSALLANAFQYDWIPTVSSFTPASGTSLGGTLVELRGGGFASPGGGPVTVRFGGSAASEVTVLDGFRLTCRAPAGVAASSVDVSVANSRGSGSLAGFLYHPVPTLSSLTPIEGPPQGGTTVTLLGSGFLAHGASAPSVRFGAALASTVTVLSDASLTCVAPPGSSGLVTVTVTNENGSAERVDGWRWVLRHPGDLDGDGRGDLVLAASDGVYVFFSSPLGPGDENTAAPDLVLKGSLPGTELGSQLALGDVDGDGQADLAIGARLDDTAGIDAGSVYVFRGPLAPSATVRFSASADLAFHGTNAGDRFGSAVAVRDVTGDGQPDLLVGAPFDDQAGIDAGAAFVYRGGAGFVSQSTAQAHARLLGGGQQHNFGSALAAGDVNGDGRADLLVAAPLNGSSGGNSGAVHVFFGGAGLTHATAAQAQVTISGAASNDKLGTTLAAGDMDGDGLDELILGAPDAKNAGSQSGSVFVVRGSPTLASGSAASALAIYNGEAAGDRLGHALAVGDVDADGKLDLLLGAPLHDVPAASAGRAYLVLGSTSLTGGSIAPRAALIVMADNSSGDQLGLAVAMNDLDGDGRAELLVGDPFSNGTATDAGRVHVFLGSALQATRFASADDATCAGHLVNQTLGRRVAGSR